MYKNICGSVEVDVQSILKNYNRNNEIKSLVHCLKCLVKDGSAVNWLNRIEELATINQNDFSDVKTLVDHYINILK